MNEEEQDVVMAFQSRIQIPEVSIGIARHAPADYYYPPQVAYTTKTQQQRIDEDIDEVIRMTGCKFHQAVSALELYHGDSIDAIIYIMRQE